MKNRSRAWTMALLSTLAVTAIAEAAGPKSNHEPGTDFSKFTSYRWQAASGPAQDGLDRDLRAEADKALAKRGLRKVDGQTDPADLELFYNVGSTDILVAGIQVVAGWWGDIYSNDQSHVSGGLVFTLSETTSGKVLWAGWIIKHGTTPNALQVMVKRAPGWADDILSRYPN